MKIGDLRRRLFLDHNCKWNGLVRDVTAKHEQHEEETPVADVHEDLLAIIRTEANLDHSFPLEEGSRIQKLFEESKC